MFQAKYTFKCISKKHQNNVIDVFRNVFQVINKDTRVTSFDIVLVSFLQTLNTIVMTFSALI